MPQTVAWQQQQQQQQERPTLVICQVSTCADDDLTTPIPRKFNIKTSTTQPTEFLGERCRKCDYASVRVYPLQYNHSISAIKRPFDPFRNSRRNDKWLVYTKHFKTFTESVFVSNGSHVKGQDDCFFVSILSFHPVSTPVSVR